MKLVLLAAAGGALGAASRYLVGIGAGRLMGHGFPWGTLTVNILGSLAMGVLIGAWALRYNAPQEVRVFLATGLLGGFTTFSAFSLDFVTLFERKEYGTALTYLMGSVGLSLLALFIGLYLSREFLK